MEELAVFVAPQAVRTQHENVELFVGEESRGLGTLYIAEGYFYLRSLSMLTCSFSNVVWWNASASKGLSLEYPCIMIHAISRDGGAFFKPCIYCQLNFGALLMLARALIMQRKMKMTTPPLSCALLPTARIPVSVTTCTPRIYCFTVETIFSAMSDCQALHPDASDSEDGMVDEDEDGDGDDGEVNEDGLNAHGQVGNSYIHNYCHEFAMDCVFS
jgi:nucleotide-sensitive chloride channel 1A